jgi:hypothetical protein
MNVRSPRILAIALAGLLAGCGPAPVPSAGPSSASPTAEPSGTTAPSATAAAAQPISASVQADGVLVTLSASADRIATGDEVHLVMTALNVGLEPATWMSGGCGMRGGLGISGPDIPDQPAGNPGRDPAALAKWSALSIGVGLAQWRPPDLPDDVMVACPAILSYDEIGPAGTETAEATWRAVDGFGAPAPAGGYTIDYDFPFIGRMSSQEVGSDAEIRPIRVSLPILVEGQGFDGLPASEAIDAATADPRVAAWFAELPVDQLTGAHIRFEDGVWEYTIDVGFDGATSVVRVDPETGDVLDVRLAGD